jgi:hypothetical protein
MDMFLDSSSYNRKSPINNELVQLSLLFTCIQKLYDKSHSQGFICPSELCLINQIDKPLIDILLRLEEEEEEEEGKSMCMRKRAD